MYMQMIYVDSENLARLTGVGAEFDKPQATWAAFESLRKLEVDPKDCDFICDLHEDEGDLIDSIAISSESYTQITGEKVLSEAEYLEIDKNLNTEMIKAAKAA